MNGVMIIRGHADMRTFVEVCRRTLAGCLLGRKLKNIDARMSRRLVLRQ